MFQRIAELPVEVTGARVFEHGWQSWSPSTSYPVSATSHRPVREHMQTMCYRPGLSAPDRGFQGEGLLAVDLGNGDAVRVFAARDGLTEVPSIRARLDGSRLAVDADGPVDELSLAGPLPAAVAAWADVFAARAVVSGLRRAPTAWCSWYHYFTEVTEQDVVENLDALAELDIPADVVQIDDGWQEEIGDWLTYSKRFTSFPDLLARIRDGGRRAGIWVAPFLVGARSTLAWEHPEWLVDGADAGFNWDQQLFALDVTHPGAADYLRRVFGELRSLGIDYVKLDFLYAGALDGRRHAGVPGLAAYGDGLRLIREAVGPDTYLLGCGAPMLPSVGLLDAMRVGPDTDPSYEPPDGDQSRPSQQAATLTSIGRAWQHGRFWVNDPDCLIARPAVQRREEWAGVVERYGGLRASSDRIRDLDEWGLATTRRLLSSVPPPTPFALH